MTLLHTTTKRIQNTWNQLAPWFVWRFWNDSSWTIIENERVTPQTPFLWIKFFQSFANVSNVRVSKSAKYKAKLVYQKASNSKYLEKNELFFVYWWLLILMIWNDTLRVKNKFYSGRLLSSEVCSWLCLLSFAIHRLKTSHSASPVFNGAYRQFYLVNNNSAFTIRQIKASAFLKGTYETWLSPSPKLGSCRQWPVVFNTLNAAVHHNLLLCLRSTLSPNKCCLIK